MKTPKAYYKMEKDAPTAADKKREADLAKALSKEDFYGKKKADTAKISPKSPMMRYKTGKKQ
jgi:hypothetical protein